MATSLFRHTEIRDLNGSNFHLERDRHIPLFLGTDPREILADFLDPTGVVKRTAVEQHVASDRFRDRAEIARFVALEQAGRTPGSPPSEWRGALSLALLAQHLVAMQQTDPNSAWPALATKWNAAGKGGFDLAEACRSLPEAWLRDLYALYFFPGPHLAYRRLLTSLRRLTRVASTTPPEQLKEVVLANQDASTHPIIAMLQTSRILIAKEYLPVRDVETPPPDAPSDSGGLDDKPDPATRPGGLGSDVPSARGTLNPGTRNIQRE